MCVIFFTTDVDECSLGSDTCHENADCTNTVGNFTCSCKTGFSGDGYSCTGVLYNRVYFA